MWTREEEEVLVERYTASNLALALQVGEAIGFRVAESIAFGQALATLHHRETLRALRDVLPRPRRRAVHNPDPNS